MPKDVNEAATNYQQAKFNADSAKTRVRAAREEVVNSENYLDRAMELLVQARQDLIDSSMTVTVESPIDATEPAPTE